MTLSSRLTRIAALLSSAALLVGYVIYSHITPNQPPPDPLGLSTPGVESSPPEPPSAGLIELTIAPEVVEFDSFIEYGAPAPVSSATTPSGGPYAPLVYPDSGLRIIGSKSINQPIFSGRNATLWDAKPEPRSQSKP